MTDLYEPKEKTFLVTEGASGIGAILVKLIVKNGAKGVAIFDVQAEKGKELAERLNKTYSSKVIFVKCDVGNEKDIDEAFNYVLEQFKQLD